MSQLPFRAAGLTKSFGRNTVLAGLDLELAPGQITVLLGANGTGKSRSSTACCLPCARTSAHCSVLRHDLEVAARAADRVAILASGRIQRHGTLAGVLEVEEPSRVPSRMRDVLAQAELEAAQC